jgi:hypothetical protein
MYRKLRPQLHEKPDRNFMLVSLSKYHPEFTYKRLGNAFGISRQRAHSIIMREAQNKRQRSDNGD